MEAKSVLEMARGAIAERADYEMARIIENIMDVNTSRGWRQRYCDALILMAYEVQKMELIIKGKPKEIAALVLELQGRQEESAPKAFCSKITQGDVSDSEKQKILEAFKAAMKTGNFAFMW